MDADHEITMLRRRVDDLERKLAKIAIAADKAITDSAETIRALERRLSHMEAHAPAEWSTQL